MVELVTLKYTVQEPFAGIVASLNTNSFEPIVAV